MNIISSICLNRKFFLSSLILFINCYCISAQNLPEPADYLSKDFHKQRRDALRSMMPDNSAMVIFAYPERVFSVDVNYVYHQNPDLYYFSGYNEPNAVLIIFKEMQHAGDNSYNELFFVQKNDPSQETWTGRRLGIDGTRSKLGFDKVYVGENFDSLCPDLTKLSTIIYDELPDDVHNDGETGSLYNLFAIFRKKANIPVEQNKQLHDDLKMIADYANTANLNSLIEYLKLETKIKTNDAYKNDENIQAIITHPDSIALQKIKTKINPSGKKSGTDIYRNLTNSLREIKTPEELALLRKAVSISSIAHAEAMKAIQPDMSERELEGILTYVHKKYGAEEEGYGAIVGAGANSCILHYEENSVTNVKNQLVLMDVAAEYHGYSADVTRTVPSNGKFTAEQKAIYQIVYDAQEEIFKLCKEGTPFNELNRKAREILSAGLLKLGIIKDAKEVSTYYPHGCSHHMGLDVHDKSNYGDLKANMVITVEPGIYIPEGSKCDKKWWDIGVRIEDDVVIGKEKCELLSAQAPRKWEDVEKTTAQKSVLNDVVLPALK
jgi:Xaa-Pro aminopeptidase